MSRGNLAKKQSESFIVADEIIPKHKVSLRISKAYFNFPMMKAIMLCCYCDIQQSENELRMKERITLYYKKQ